MAASMVVGVIMRLLEHADLLLQARSCRKDRAPRLRLKTVPEGNLQSRFEFANTVQNDPLLRIRIIRQFSVELLEKRIRLGIFTLPTQQLAINTGGIIRRVRLL